MKNLSYVIISLALLAASCVKSPEQIQVVSGKPARLSFNLTVPGMEKVSRGLLESEEQAIQRLYIYVFYESGDLVSKTKIPDTDLANIEVDAYSGNNMSVFVIANYMQGEYEAALDEVTSFEDLMEIQMATQRRDIDVLLTPEFIPMVGYAYEISIAAGYNSVPIKLEYALAKITIRIEDLTTTNAATMVGWDVGNIATRSFLIEHGKAGGTGGKFPVDAVDPADDSHFFTSEMKYLWEKNESQNGNFSSASSSSFYIFENRRGGRKTGVQPLPGMTDEEYNGFRGKTLCAPERASYVKAYFEYVNSNDGNTYSTTMNVFLGKDNYGDYNVERGYEYIYTFRIHEGYDISVDLQVNSNLQAEVVPMIVSRSSSMIMDAHPDFRVIHMKASSDAVANVSIEVYDEAGNSFDSPGFSAQWLKISRLNIGRFQVSQSTPEGQIWQQPYGGQEGYFARAKYIPHKSYRHKLAARNSAYVPPTGITLGDDASDYPEDDDSLPYEKATRRMCYKITDIPFEAAGSNHEFVVYADDYEYMLGATSRSAYIVVLYNDLTDLDETTGSPKRKHFEGRIIQRQPFYVGLGMVSYHGDESTVGTITTTEDLQALVTYRQMAMEIIEESSLKLNPSAGSSLQSTDIMQWGYLNTRLYDGSSRFLHYGNGYYLTANAVYNDVTIDADGNVSWDGSGTTQRPKWGSRAYKNKNFVIPEGTANIYNNNGSQGNSGPPFYYPNSMNQSASENQTYHPIYNSAAARYCHEKNRDLNGDGIISPEETFWYLPSQHELQQIWVNYESIQSTATEYGTGFYWSSSEVSAANAWALGFTTGYAIGGGYSKGAPQGSDIASRNGAVRCVRKYRESDYRRITIENGKPYMEFAHLQSHTITTKPKGTGTGQVGNDTDDGLIVISENGATLFLKFRVAVNDAGESMPWPEAVGYSTPYSGTYPADYKLGVASGSYSYVNPAATLMRNAPANQATGCNGYYEEPDGSDKGLWRLPNKRELLMMWIMKTQLENISGFTPFAAADYWSASERRSTLGQTVSFATGHTVNPGKAESRRVRCIREDLRVATFPLIFHGNGGTGCPANVMVNADINVTLPDRIPVHPDGYAFAGWNTRRDGSGLLYRAGAEFPMEASDVTLYAQWIK